MSASAVTARGYVSHKNTGSVPEDENNTAPICPEASWILLAGTLVGLDDALHKGVAHDVFLTELHATYALHIAEHTQSLHKAARSAARKVYLRHVAAKSSSRVRQWRPGRSSDSCPAT